MVAWREGGGRGFCASGKGLGGRLFVGTLDISSSSHELGIEKMGLH